MELKEGSSIRCVHIMPLWMGGGEVLQDGIQVDLYHILTMGGVGITAPILIDPTSSVMVGVHWQQRGSNSGTSGFLASPMGGTNYNFRHDRATLTMCYGFSGPGYNIGITASISYDRKNGFSRVQVGGHAGISIGDLLGGMSVATSDDPSNNRPQLIAQRRNLPGEEAVTGFENPVGLQKLFGEKNPLMKAVDFLCLHPTAVIHDNIAISPGAGDFQFFATMIPSFIAAGHIAGNRYYDNYGILESAQ